MPLNNNYKGKGRKRESSQGNHATGGAGGERLPCTHTNVERKDKRKGESERWEKAEYGTKHFF